MKGKALHKFLLCASLCSWCLCGKSFTGDVTLKLTINGEPRDLAAATVLALLEELGLNPAATVVERNGEIVVRGAYAETKIMEGDVLELVRLVGGG